MPNKKRPDGPQLAIFYPTNLMQLNNSHNWKEVIYLDPYFKLITLKSPFWQL